MLVYDPMSISKKRKYSNFDESVVQNERERVESLPLEIAQHKIDVEVMMSNTMRAQSQSFRNAYTKFFADYHLSKRIQNCYNLYPTYCEDVSYSGCIFKDILYIESSTSVMAVRKPVPETV